MPDHKPDLLTRPWAERSNTLGVLPGKSNDQVEALRRIAQQLPLDVQSDVEVVGANGERRRVSADRLFTAQLSRGSFVRRQDSAWELTDATQYWIESKDNQYLAQHIQGNVKLFGELLAMITDETRTGDLMKAAEAYGLYWTSPDQIHRRLGWLESLGLIERWGMSRLVVTEEGRRFLNEARLTSQDDARGSGAVTDDESAELPVPGELVAKSLAKVADDLPSRKVLIGYIPRGQKAVGRPSDETQVSAADATRNFVDLVEERASSEELFRRASAEFGMKKSSFTQSMHTFRNMRVIDMVAYGQYGITQEGRQFLAPGQEVDLVRFIHTRYRFVGEILRAADSTITVSELARQANQDFGCDQIDTSEIRTRLSFMADAGLVQRVDWTRYATTNLGRALAAELPLEEPREPTVADGQEDGVDYSDKSTNRLGGIDVIDNLKAELIRCSRLNEATSIEFEKVVARAFEALGFLAEHIGGPSRTDVLVTAELSEADRYSSIVDAKASATGIVGDNAIKFDRLKDHRRKHSATYGVVVGPDFQGQIKQWAHNNNFVLLTADELANLVERQQKNPLSLRELRYLFDPQTASLEKTEARFDERRKEIEVLCELVGVLTDEANDEDPVAGGEISLENLQYAMRTRVSPRPTRDEVKMALTLLTNPLLRAVEVNDDRYRLVDSASNIKRRLAAFGVGIK